MSKSLYNIAAEYQHLSDQLIESEGELTPELQELLSINKDELEYKGQSYAMVIKGYESDITVINSEIQRLIDLSTRRNKAIERLKNNLKAAMLLYGYDKIETPLVKLSFRKSESVEIINEAQLDQKYMVEKITVTPNKVAIKNDIKAGIEVEGAVLSVNQNLQIK